MTDELRITDLLRSARTGSAEASERLYAAVYPYMTRIAHRRLQAERTGHTLETSGLVHETYLRLQGSATVDWEDRNHFFRVAATAMRHVLVDHARRLQASRRGGNASVVELDSGVASGERGEELIALDEALDRLAIVSPRLATVVECRYFTGFTEEETARVLGLTVRTVQRDWAKAKAWLYTELKA